MLFLMRRLIRFPVIFDHTIQQAVAPVDQLLGRQTVSFLCLADFLSMMLTDAVYGIVGSMEPVRMVIFRLSIQ